MILICISIIHAWILETEHIVCGFLVPRTKIDFEYFLENDPQLHHVGEFFHTIHATMWNELSALAQYNMVFDASSVTKRGSSIRFFRVFRMTTLTSIISPSSRFEA